MMNDRGIKTLVWALYWPVLLLLFFFAWLFSQSKEEAKKTEAWAEALRLEQTDSLLFGETHRKY